MTNRRRPRHSVGTVAALVAILVLLLLGRVDATNHDIFLKEIMVGANGNSKIQFIVIVQEFFGQNLWGPQFREAQSRAMLVFFDATGRETGKFKFPANPPSPCCRSDIPTLIATQEFADLPGAPTPDIIIPPLLNPISGKVCFKSNPANPFGFPRNECLSYGSFTGDTEINSGGGAIVAAGPPAASLPVVNAVSLRRTAHTGVNADFVITSPPTPANTAGATLTLPQMPLVTQGATLFANETFAGNGRTCASCHIASESFRLSPANIQARFATLSTTFDPQFIGETAPSSFDVGFDFNLNTLVLTTEVASNAPCTGELRGIITTSGGGRAKVLTRLSPTTYLVYGGRSPALSGTVSDGQSCAGTVASITAGTLAAPASSAEPGLEDPKRMRTSASADFPQGRALILENIDGFPPTPPVFRKSPHLLNMSRTAPFGFSGDILDLQTFTTGAVRQHFPRTLTRSSSGSDPDFRLPTSSELSALEAFLLAQEFPAGDDPSRFALSRFVFTAAQTRGRDAFFGGVAKCSQCHGGDVLAQTTVSILDQPTGVNARFNTGVVNQALNAEGADNLPCEPSVGACGSREFSVPQLFNVKKLTPLFHDGSAATVRQAVEFYTSPAFSNSPAGMAIGGISMPAAMINDITAFLEGLSGGSVSAISSVNLSGTAGSPVSPAPSVVVVDDGGTPLPGVSVMFAITSGGGSLAGASQTTNDSGVATLGSWTLGRGTNTLIATATGAFAGNSVTFTATGVGVSLTLTSNGTGSGTVTSSPTGIDCGSTCSAAFADGVVVTLTARAGPGSTFAAWSGGACGGSGTCVITMNADTAVTATFTAQRSLTVSKGGVGSGTVTSSPAGIDCGSTCSGLFTDGTGVTLTASAAPESTFAAWSGGGCNGIGACVLTMSADTSVTAIFAAFVTLMVNRAGTGADGAAVTSSPPGITCGSRCSASFLVGSRVTLTAVAPASSAFRGWSGGGCSGTGPCTVTMTSDISVSAMFVDGPGAMTLVAAVLPSSRSIQTGSAATAFVTIINPGDSPATAVGISLSTSGPMTLDFQTTDPATNRVTRRPDTPVDIPAGGSQPFVISLTPTAALNPSEVEFVLSGTNAGPVATLTGINTLLFSASDTPVPDIVALAATINDDGIVDIPGASGTGAFAVATVNVGASGTITASADTGAGTPPVALSLCQTDPASGACLSPPAPVATTSIAANATPTFAIFVKGTGTVPFDAAMNRIFVRFRGADGVTRGSTSVAVRTQ